MHAILRVVGRQSRLTGHVCAKSKWQLTPATQFRAITTSFPLAKVHKKGHEEQRKNNVLLESDSEHIRPMTAEMNRLEETFLEQLDKRLSFRTDLRLYEDFYVDFPDGKRHPLSNVAMISKKGQMINIFFGKHPSYASHAIVELQKAMPDVNIQQEGPYLHIKAPTITRERRKEMIASVKKSLLNDYKKALNKVYSTSIKKFEAIKAKDEQERNKNVVLHNKRVMEERAEAKIKEREEKLLAEIV